jgi:hypothetical protein
MASYLTSLSPNDTLTPLNGYFDYGLGCLRQVYHSDGGTGMTLVDLLLLPLYVLNIRIKPKSILS